MTYLGTQHDLILLAIIATLLILNLFLILTTFSRVRHAAALGVKVAPDSSKVNLYPTYLALGLFILAVLW